MSLVITKYYGQGNELVTSTDSHRATCSDKLVKLQIMIQEKYLNSMDKSVHISWRDLKDDIDSVVALLGSSDASSNQRLLRRFQLDLIREAVIPYIEKIMEPRLSLDVKRFQQIHAVRYAICDIPYLPGNDHPSHSLLAVDEIIEDVRRSSSSYLWPSNFLTTLEAAAKKQWDPILLSHSRLLQSVASYLLVMGSFSLVWWPVASGLILYRWLIPIQKIMQEWQNRRQFSPDNVFELLQASIFLLALGRLLELLQTNVAMGWSSAAAGGVLLFLSSSRQTLKHIVPVVAPHAVSIEQVMQQIASSEMLQKGLGMMVGTVSTLLTSGAQGGLSGSSNRASEVPITSSQVEELPDDPVGSAEASPSNPSSHPDGMRRRK